MLILKNVSMNSLEGEEILKEVSTSFQKNSVNLILGPNGAGKTSLGEVISGVTDFEFTGDIFLNKQNITKLPIYEKSKLGIFLAYQHPVEIPGLKILDFLHTAYNSMFKTNLDVWNFYDIALESLNKLNLDASFLQRSLNEGFSGGEKKKFEIAQMLILKPKIIVLDEIDSGLDIDSIKQIFDTIKEYQTENQPTIILISHNPKILKYIAPDKVILMKNGSVQEEGDVKLAKKILKYGYQD